MKIPPDEIDIKEVAGKTKDGRPVVYIATKGGLHAFFSKDEDGKVAAIGAAPMKAVAKFLAGKKEDVRWNEEFSKSEDLSKSEKGLFDDLRKMMFLPSLPEAERSDVYLVYDTSAVTISMIAKSELEEEIRTNKINRFSLLRDMSMVNAFYTVHSHPDFKHLFKG